MQLEKYSSEHIFTNIIQLVKHSEYCVYYYISYYARQIVISQSTITDILSRLCHIQHCGVPGAVHILMYYNSCYWFLHPGCMCSNIHMDFACIKTATEFVQKLKNYDGCHIGFYEIKSDSGLLPSAPGFLDSSILISFFFTFRVELTSLWSLLNVTDSSCSLSDRSQG